MDDAEAQVRYECVPYPSKPQELIHPELLAVVSTLFGGHPTPVGRARILKLVALMAVTR